MTNDNYDFGMLSSDEVRTGFISGATFKNKPVQYFVVDGMAVFEGCIVLGTAAEMEAKKTALLSGQVDGEDNEIQLGVGLTGEQYRWPGALMPYDIDSALPSQNRVTDAIAHWEQNTNMRFVLRTSSNAAQYPNYVHFKPSSGCWAVVGMRGGKQDIGLASGCSTGTTIHEIGHALGLWHAQSREDRGTHVAVHLQNVLPGKEPNFDQHITDGDDYGAYDYGSIMHYSGMAFSKNGNPTITTKPPGTPIGQRNALSANDIATIHAMYTTWHNNKTVLQTYSTHHSQNAWARIQSLGWRKVETVSKAGVTNTFLALCEAQANNRQVNVYADGDKIFRMYLL